MCGRYVIKTPPALMRQALGYGEQPNFPPRYNVAPTQPIPVMRLVDGRRSFALLRWGFIPAWVKDPRGFSLLINARAESVLEKPAFRNAMRRRRCLIPADGFYEWKRDGARKRPHVVRPKGLVAFAGLWEPWMGPNGEEVETACIVTTAANRTLRSLHDRMPAVIPPDAFDRWLDCANVDAEAAAALLMPAPEDLFEAYEISTAVNRTANDSAALIEPLAPGAPDAMEPRPAARARPKKETDDGQQSLF
jgi:putative SOS response-associated peptidase YedK